MVGNTIQARYGAEIAAVKHVIVPQHLESKTCNVEQAMFERLIRQPLRAFTFGQQIRVNQY